MSPCHFNVSIDVLAQLTCPVWYIYAASRRGHVHSNLSLLISDRTLSHQFSCSTHMNMADLNYANYCIRRHCGLCTFELIASEQVIASESVPHDFMTMSLLTYHAALPGRQEVQHVIYMPCAWSCTHSGGLADAFHLECHDIAGKPSPGLSALTHCDFDPSPLTSMANADKNCVYRSLDVPGLSRLPADLRYELASYLVQTWCTVSTLKLRATKARTEQLDLSSKIWACLVKVHNRIYVATLTNKEPVNTPSRIRILVHEPTPRPSTVVVYVARDSWGIRKIMFLKPEITLGGQRGINVTQSAGVWWQTLVCTTKTRTLAAYTDVLTLPLVSPSQHSTC